MKTWAPWPRSTRPGTTATTRNGGAAWRRNPFGSVGKTTRRKSLDEIIDQIKRGVAPWQKPWKPGEQISAENFSTGQKYSGGNSLYLMSRASARGEATTVGEPTTRSEKRAGRFARARKDAGFVLHGSHGQGREGRAG